MNNFHSFYCRFKKNSICVFPFSLLQFRQMSAILRNTTGIEDWILEKAQIRRYGSGDNFNHPYSKGWKFNVSQVLTWNCRPVGDGIVWPVNDACDQYTLTVRILFLFNFHSIAFSQFYFLTIFNNF